MSTLESHFKPLQKSGENPREGQALHLPSQPVQPPLGSQPRMLGTEMGPTAAVKEGMEQTRLEKLCKAHKYLEKI